MTRPPFITLNNCSAVWSLRCKPTKNPPVTRSAKSTVKRAKPAIAVGLIALPMSSTGRRCVPAHSITQSKIVKLACPHASGENCGLQTSEHPANNIINIRSFAVSDENTNLNESDRLNPWACVIAKTESIRTMTEASLLQATRGTKSNAMPYVIEGFILLTHH